MEYVHSLHGAHSCSSGRPQFELYNCLFLSQVTIYGSWKFFSTLPVPLCMKLTSLLTEEDREGSASPLIPSPSLPSTSLPSPPSFSSLPSQPFPHSGLRIEKTLVVQPKGCSPSILGPRRELGGMVLRTEGEGPVTEWSSVFPLPCEEGWSKPHLLVEVCVLVEVCGTILTSTKD